MQFKDVLEWYKSNLDDARWQTIKEKWECVRWFRSHWKPEDPNIPFADMLSASLERIGDLCRLIDADSTPFEHILNLAAKAPDEVRQLFDSLCREEGKDIAEWIGRFQNGMLSLLENTQKGSASFYFSETTTSILQWLCYPDSYNIYRFWEAKTISEKLLLPYEFRIGADGDNLRNADRMYDALRMDISGDEELLSQAQLYLDAGDLPEEIWGVLASDLISSLAAHLAGPDNDRNMSLWFANLSAWEWTNLLVDRHLFLPEDLELLEQMKACGVWKNYDALTEYAQDYRKTEDTENYNRRVIRLCQRLIHKLGFSSGTTKGILHEECLLNGEPAWKLRSALSKALYTRKDFLSEVYMNGESFHRLKNVLLKKKNLILQGAPGVGKTFTAKRLAYAVTGARDDDRICFIQFHQSYSYEDFVMGYRPSEDGFTLHYGIFYQFCQRAAAEPDRNFFFIIDEINRGNISKIFGELLMLIERDYRGTEAVLAYDGKPFSVPENLYIIGMMNTADRNLAMIDYALRRRFAFFRIDPGFCSPGFQAYRKSLNNPHFDALIEKIQELNFEIAGDLSLGKGFCIGHSYFCGCTIPADCTDEWMESVVDYDILPLLDEYWGDSENNREKDWEQTLHGIFEK